MSDFVNKTVAVLNASGGIGLAVAKAFLSNGATVVAIDRAAGLEQVTNALEAEGNGRLHVLEYFCEPARLFDACEGKAGAVDVFVCAAPPVGQVKVLDMDAEALRDTVEGELVLPALLMQEAARRMTVRGNGRIIVFSTMAAKTGVHTFVAPFAAAKGGLLAYARVMAAELASSGVTVNAIATSLFEPQVAHLEPGERERLSLGVPVRRFGRPTEAAHAALFLASPDAAFVTGETMNLSGGRFMD